MMQISKSKQILGLAFWLIITFTAAAIGAFASAKAGIFYQELIRPEWAPPAWLFAPVWTILYTLIAVDAWLVWRAQGFHAARIALSLFIVQLVVNALWTWLFFAWKQGAISFFEILILWAMILYMIVAFWRVRPIYGILLFPYFAWVSFASILTFSIWKLNPLVLI
jgi:translocator protein